MNATTSSFPGHIESGPDSAGANSSGAPAELSGSRTTPALAVVHSADTREETVIAPEAPLSLEVEQFIKSIDAEKVLLIPAGVVIKADLVSNGNAVVISGTVEGRIMAGSAPVIVKPGGEVVGSIESDEYVVVAGKVSAPEKDGDAIVTKGLLVLAASGSIKGTVAYGRQRAYEGGMLSGRAVPYAERL